MTTLAEGSTLKNIAIINAFPIVKFDIILNVGCGDCELDFYLKHHGLNIISTDIKKSKVMEKSINFHKANIYDLKSFPVETADIVICSQVLEHLDDYTKALFNLMQLTEQRLIITIPYKTSFLDPGHVNFWGDDTSEGYQDIQDFIDLCAPYSVSISKIITKKLDIKSGARNYLIIIDKTQIG